MTYCEAIIAHRLQLNRVTPGETYFIPCDLAIGSELIFPHILNNLRALGDHLSSDTPHIALINGHLVPTREAAAGTLVTMMDRFAKSHPSARYFQAGRSGSCQFLLAERGLVKPGDIVVGSDLRTTSYGAIGALAMGVGGADLAGAWVTGKIWLTVPISVRIQLVGTLPPYCTIKDLAFWIFTQLKDYILEGRAVEFCGPGVHNLSIYQRLVLCNLMAETGARFVYFPPDEVTFQFLTTINPDISLLDLPSPDRDGYQGEYTIYLDEIVPMVALPYDPTQCIPARDVKTVKVDAVVIGSCTNGDIEDFRQVARILEHNEIATGVRLGLFPSTYQTIRQIIEEDLELLFTAKGASLAPPSCQPCLGSGPSLIGPQEVGVYTTNRNYRGRHGPPSARIYLSGHLVAIASAITGYITDPRDLEN